jgi:hypothetical protein
MAQASTGGTVQALESGDPQQVGGYRLLARLGAGGMGRVYLARSRGGRRVALKVIRAELADDPDFRARFAREVASARAVGGAFTVAVLDADAEADTPWLATEYVAGPALSEAVREHGPLPADSVRALAAGLAEALVAIHRAGVVHRDLKPANVLLAADGPRVIDFGISRAMEATELTRTGVIVGSPGFMSPEQIEGSPVTPATDVFSLGAVLAYAATGAGPFGEGAAPSLLYRVVHGEPKLDAVPEELRGLIGSCLAKDPAARPGPDALLDRLEAEAEAERAGREDPHDPTAMWLPAELTGMIAQVAASGPGPETAETVPAPVVPPSWPGAAGRAAAPTGPEDQAGPGAAGGAAGAGTPPPGFGPAPVLVPAAFAAEGLPGSGAAAGTGAGTGAGAGFGPAYSTRTGTGTGSVGSGAASGSGFGAGSGFGSGSGTVRTTVGGGSGGRRLRRKAPLVVAVALLALLGAAGAVLASVHGSGSSGRHAGASLPGVSATAMASDSATTTATSSDSTATGSATAATTGTTAQTVYLTVPTVTGQPVDYAKQLLTDRGFPGGDIQVSYHCTQAGPGVYRQSPGAGSRVPRDSVIRLSASEDDCVAYESYVGLPVATAKADLKGFSQVTVTYACSGGAAAGTVLAQSPAATPEASYPPSQPIGLTVQGDGCGSATPSASASASP